MTDTPNINTLIALERELTNLEAIDADYMRRNVPTPREHFVKVQNLRIRLLRVTRAWLRIQEPTA